MQIKRKDGPGSPDKPRVYVNSIFEIQENATALPSNKVTRDFPVLLFRTVSDRVADPHHLDAGPDPAFYFNENADLDFTLMRIRILLLIKVMEICDHWSLDPTLYRAPF